MAILGRELADMNLSVDEKCLVATPVWHLPKVKSFLLENDKYFYVNERCNESELRHLLKSSKVIKYLFVNPNAQGYLLGPNVLHDSCVKGINTCSTGKNHLDLKYCNDNSIQIYSLTNDYELINNLPSTSELAFVLMQGLFRNLSLCLSKVHTQGWDYTGVMGHQLAGSTVGILGYGRLGKIFANQLSGFNVKTLICESNSDVKVPAEYDQVTIEELFSSSDAVAIHIHSTEANKGLISSDLLAKAKRGIYIVNTSRGDIVDEEAISEKIVSGDIGGYATDVLESEFSNISDSPIFKLFQLNMYNILVTPHVGGMTFEGQEKAFLYALKKFKLS